MPLFPPNPVKSIEHLRNRVDRLFRPRPRGGPQLDLALPVAEWAQAGAGLPKRSVRDFLDFLCNAVPTGEVFLFGGLIRDVALLGARGFNSDVDVVVEGDWELARAYIESLGARRNKFGGYRLEVAEWPIDVWNAEATWAIVNGFVEYKGIASLTQTTVLNWDAILMNWRTRGFIYSRGYFEAIREGVLDIVLEANPNPLGMATRVFRHLCAKDAAKITMKAALYLARAAAEYPFQMLRAAEIRSYSESLIQPEVYEFFKRVNAEDDALELRCRFGRTTEAMRFELGIT
jgi:hypothetical protein